MNSPLQLVLLKPVYRGPHDTVWMTTLTRNPLFWSVLACVIPAAFLPIRADWPQYRADAGRSGYTAESLAEDLAPAWEYVPLQGPQPAWTGEDTRMPFDFAFHPVVADGRVFFGSSADCRLRALSAGSGEELWSVSAEAPIRFAPVAWRHQVLVNCDDGYLYCHRVEDGTLLWKRRPGPAPDLVLGNGRMISRWPGRGGPVLTGDTLVFGAGIWPSEGISLTALDLRTGRELWLNDSAGGIEMDQPHGGARARSGVSCQGYLTVDGNRLLVPTGRATPAGFDLESGAFRYFRLQEYSGRGAGPFITTFDGLHVCGNEVFRNEDGQLLAKGFRPETLAVAPDEVVWAGSNRISGIRRDRFVRLQSEEDAKSKATTRWVTGEPAWSTALPAGEVVSMIRAGDTAIIGLSQGTDGSVVIVDLAACRGGDEKATGHVTFPVVGKPLGLAAAGGRLFVSTSTGAVHCFASEAGNDRSGHLQERHAEQSVAEDATTSELAGRILQDAGVSRGYALVIPCGTGELAAALARRSELQVIGIEPDGAKVDLARQHLAGSGLYGTRVTVLQRSLADTTLPSSFANLIVVPSDSTGDVDSGMREELERLQRPCGGVLCLHDSEGLSFQRKGAPPGAGTWTHQYADPGNTGASEDVLLRAPLEVLWFADNDLEMPSRHGRGPSPLLWEGILIVEGIDGLRALDAYNGTLLWDYPLPGILQAYDQEHLNGVAITGSNICLGEGSVFVRHKSRCLRLNARSGRLLRTYHLPRTEEAEEEEEWGYLACVSGIVLGSVTDARHQVAYAYGRSDMSELYSESKALFALDVDTGRFKWVHRPAHSIRNNSIAVGGGRVHLIDRPLAARDQKQGRHEWDPPQPPGTLVALDLESGKQEWRHDDDIYGTMLAVSEEHDILLMAYQSTRFSLSSELGGRMTAWRASEGSRLWDVREPYLTRPLINGGTVYAQPGAWDLLTGARSPFKLSRSYGCGTLSASRNLLAFRSATLGYVDLTDSQETESYGGIRPGCWINAIPAGGLLLMPESSNRCICSYLIKATVALQPAR